MGLWAAVKHWFYPEPMRSTDDDGDDSFSVNVIGGVAVPGPGMMGASSYRPGMSNPAAWRCANLIAGLLGSMPWHVLRERPGRPPEILEPTPPLLERPDPRPNETRMSTFSAWGLDYVWEGNAVGIIAARDAEGWPTAVLPVPTRMVGVRRVHEHSVLPIGAVEYNIGGIVFGEHEIIHVRGPHEPGEVRGMGVLEAHFETFDLAREQRQQSASLAKHGVPTGKLKVTNPDATKEDLENAKKGWLKAQRERTVAVLNAVTDFEPLSWNPDELQLAETRKLTRQDVSDIFGVPAKLLNLEGPTRTYSTQEGETLDFLRFSFDQYLAPFEQTLSLYRPRGQRVKANLDALLRPDTKTRYEAHSTALGGKAFLTVDEVRAVEDRGPMPEQAPPALPPSDDAANEGEGEDDE